MQFWRNILWVKFQDTITMISDTKMVIQMSNLEKKNQRNMTFDREKAKGFLYFNFLLCIIVKCHGDRITL